MKKRVFFAILLILILGGLYFYGRSSGFFAEDPRLNLFIFGEHTLSVDIADNNLSRSQGLSGVEFLEEGHAILFVFQEPQKPGFWMKDMNFPIDILWFDESKKLIEVTENISPDTFPESFYPNKPVLYVLETKVGEFESPEKYLGQTFELSTRKNGK